MSLPVQIDSLINRADSVIRRTARKQRLRLYAEGLKAKIWQAEFALFNLSKYAGRTDQSITSTIPAKYNISDHVHFYCDTFWTCLYSSLDVLGQVVNQALNLRCAERDVAFKKISQILNSRHAGTPIQRKVSACIRSRAFRNLDAYRNCSTHRRQIYIEERRKSIRGTAGYRSTTGSMETVVHVLCDNPLDLNPRTRQKRKIPNYMEDIRDEVLVRIEEIVRAINPLR